LENLNLVVTVQEYLGNAIEVINKKLVKEIAKLMANMHKVSEDKNCHIHNDTIWSLWKYDSDIMRGYVDTYRSIRKLNIFEIRAMNDIYAVVVPFWWSRIIFEEEGSLIYIVKKKDRRNLREFLNETYRMLGLKYFN